MTLQQVRPVDGSGMDVDDDLLRPGKGVRHLLPC